MNQTDKHIRALVRARFPLIYVLSHEEGRVLAGLAEVAEVENYSLLVWSVTRGLFDFACPDRPVSDEAQDYLGVLRFIPRYQGDALFVLLDFHAFLRDPVAVRGLRDLVRELTVTQKTVIILSPSLVIPPEMEKEITVVDYPLPTREELGAIADEMVQRLPEGATVDLDDESREALIRALQGLTATEAENALALAVVTHKGLDPRAIPLIIREKKQIVRKSRALEFFPVEELNLGQVGGLDNLKAWLRLRASGFSEAAREYGLEPPRGVFLVGVPGTGKSLTAKAIGGEWGMPVIRLDMGAVFQGVVGSSEENIRLALKMAEAVAPCILWCDEIEKGLAGLGSSNVSDAGTTARVFSTILTWMQEHTSPVFVAATCNDVTALPPELPARFDEIFFLDLPTEEERKEIFAIHLARRERDPEKFDLEALARASEGLVGREIERAVKEGMRFAFTAGREVETADILQAVKTIVPLRELYRERIEALRTWAAGRARPASGEPEGEGKEQARRLRL
nr:AAA family ATPase [Anaerolineae bacterium]